jgi:hypothetical protein
LVSVYKPLVLINPFLRESEFKALYEGECAAAVV